MVTTVLAHSLRNIIVTMVTGTHSLSSALLPFACHHSSPRPAHQLGMKLSEPLPTFGRAQGNGQDRATNGLVHLQRSEEP